MLGTYFKNRYLLDAELGQGGMGIVYRAHDTLLERDVAVKILNNTNIGSEGRARMLREAQAAARLNHPNIVSIYDAGEEENISFIVMELLDGDSLYDLKNLGLAEILKITRQICNALEHAHAHGIIHRDLKPENVIVTRSGVAKLTDFGLARSIASRITLEGALIGTIYYMAPEQALGEDLDGRTDLYALGVMLYELTTGRLPFTADDPVAVISQHLYAPVIPPRNYVPTLPAALDSLILSLLSKQRQDRPESAATVQRMLQPEALETESILPETSSLDQLVRGRLIAREREFALAKSIWRGTSTAPGKTPVLLISGESGVGKTPLVREIGALVEVSGSLVLRAECYPEGSAPYTPIAQLVSEAIKLPGLDLPDYLLADLIKLAPELRLRFPQLALNLPADPQGEQQRLFDSVVSLFTSLSSRSPVLICLEDIHWADGESLFLLRHLARRARIAHQPLLLLLTYHEADIDSNCCLGDVLLDLSRELLAERIKLSRYDRSQTEQVLEVMFQDKMDAAFVDAIYRETEGNLFYIEEICKALIEQGMLYSEECHWRVSSLADLQLPQSIRLTIQSRLNKLPAEVQDVLRLAAVIGREFDYQLLHAACDLNEDQLIDALETAVRTQLIYESKPKRLERQSAQGDSFNFAHRLIATALKESLSGLRRSRLHRRVATALLALYPDDLDALAYHYEQAKDTKNAVLYYIKAGDRARRIYANREAERYYRAALDLADDGHELGAITAGLGEALFSQSRFEEAIQSWQKAIQVYQDTSESDSDQAAHLYARSARAAWFLNDEARGLAICREGMASLTITAETPGIAALLHETARACYFNNLPDEALDLCEKALALAERLELIDVQADTLATLGILPNQTLQARIEFLGKAIKLAESAGLLSAASRAHLNLSSQLSEMGELHAARAHALKGYEHARKLGNSTFMLIYLTSVSFISVELAEFDLARQYLAEVRALRESIPGPSMQIDDIDHIERTILDMQGEWEQTAESAMAYLQNPPENTSPGDLARAKLLLANSLIERDQFGEALKVTDEILKVAPNDKNNTLLLVLFLNAASHTYLGNLEQASQAISKMEASRPAEPNFYYDIFTPLAKANLLAYQGEWEQADRLYQSQIEYTQQHKLRWHQARILLNWAQVDLLAKRGESAEQTRLHLEQARQIFTTIKASGYLQKIQKYLAEVAADPEQGDNVA